MVACRMRRTFNTLGHTLLQFAITDRITLPCRELRTTIADPYAMAFREMAHATGHPEGLNRASIADVAPFSSNVRVEELIVEMSVAYLLAAQVQTATNYILTSHQRDPAEDA